MFGIIGGSGLESIDWLENAKQLNVETEYGVASATLGKFKCRDIVFVSRHGADHKLPPHKINYRANIAALKKLHVDSIVATNAVGGIEKRFVPGSFAVPNQIIDYTWGREHTFYSEFARGMQHVDFSYPFSENLRSKLVSALEGLDQKVIDGGCYGCTQGPRLETAAEINKLRLDGCTMVGMTGMPEAALAREADIPYASICFSVNWAAGIEGTVSMDEILAHLTDCTSAIGQLWPRLLNLP